MYSAEVATYDTNNTRYNISLISTTPEANMTATDLYSLYYAMGILQAIITLTGVIFNALNIYVLVRLVRRRKNMSPTYHLLIAMGAADLAALFFYSIFALSVYTRYPPLLFYDLMDVHSDYFHVLHYVWSLFINPFSIASNWLVVATTVFRFLAVVFPMKVCQWCTLSRMRASIILIFLLSLAINIPTWSTLRAYVREDGRHRVEDTPMYNKLDAYFIVYPVFEVYIPFIIDFILVIFLIINLNSAATSMASSIQDGTAAARVKEHRKIGIMLIAIVLWFLICNIPGVIYEILRAASALEKSEIQKTEFLQKFGIIKNVGPLLNHAGNIFFYCLCNRTYRRMFVNTLTSVCNKQKMVTHSQPTTMTQVSSRHEYVARLREIREDESKCDRKCTSSESSPFIKKNYKKIDESADQQMSDDEPWTDNTADMVD